MHCFAGIGVRVLPHPRTAPARAVAVATSAPEQGSTPVAVRPSGWRADRTHRAPSRRRVRPKRAGSAAAQTRCRRSAARPDGRRALGPPSQRRALTGYAGRMPAKERPDFVHPVTVRLHHTDAAGVIFCSRLLELAHEAYEALLDEAGLSVGRILADGALRLPVVALEAEFNAADPGGGTVAGGVDRVPARRPLLPGGVPLPRSGGADKGACRDPACGARRRRRRTGGVAGAVGPARGWRRRPVAHCFLTAGHRRNGRRGHRRLTRSDPRIVSSGRTLCAPIFMVFGVTERPRLLICQPASFPIAPPNGRVLTR